MANVVLSKLRRKPKWKLRQERDELQLDQKKLREETDALRTQLANLMNDENIALKANNVDVIAVLDHQIDETRKKIDENEKHYKSNAEDLEIYSKIIKNDREGRSVVRNSIFGAIGTLGGLGLWAVGMKKAYDSDQDGTLVNKKTLDWVGRLPILRSFGKK